MVMERNSHHCVSVGPCCPSNVIVARATDWIGEDKVDEA